MISAAHQAAVLAQGSSDGFELSYVAYGIGGMLFGALIGGLLGGMKGRTVLGAVLGALLGCIGWVIVLLLPKKALR